MKFLLLKTFQLVLLGTLIFITGCTSHAIVSTSKDHVSIKHASYFHDSKSPILLEQANAECDKFGRKAKYRDSTS